MAHFKYQSAHSCFRGLVSGIHDGWIPTVKTPSRVGDVLQIPEPVTLTYEQPLQRVVFNEARDCNPFFHVMESLWMLAGRNDVKPMEYYNSNIGKIASDDQKFFHGAYGKRWRKWFGYDQIEDIIHEFKNNPNSRRCVLSMWDACCCEEVKGAVRHDLYMAMHGGKDVPCNTHAYFLVNQGRLDMTVCNRSNDLVWGALGANVVHFSYLQEYLAAHIGVPVGVYNQFTNNLHVYVERWDPKAYLADTVPDYYAKFGSEKVEPFPLVKDPAVFDEELYLFNEHCIGNEDLDGVKLELQEPFFKDVAFPMAMAYWLHKHRLYKSSLEWCSEIAAQDWRIACTTWIRKRQAAWQNRDPYHEQARKEAV